MVRDSEGHNSVADNALSEISVEQPFAFCVLSRSALGLVQVHF